MPSPRERANAIRALSMDAVQKANSGHPGAPMGMADIAEVLWHRWLSHNPANPNWLNRDRFVLSNGHGSMMLYSLLHLAGYDLPLDQLKSFRQLHSQTPGHPEFGFAPGVETTTGPLGQGLANAVGFALAEKVLAGQFNRPGHPIVDHFTYVFAGDGCLMEGISHEACSLAGTHRLGKMIAFYDDNGISIDGEVEGWFTDDTAARFGAYGWQTIGPVDGHDADAVDRAIEEARQDTTRPSLIICKTVIGFGAPNLQGKEACHGAPLGDDEIRLAREKLDWPYPAFEVPDSIRNEWDARARGAEMETAWTKRLEDYRREYPDECRELLRRAEGKLPATFAARADEYIAAMQNDGQRIASRKASQNSLNAYGPMLPELLGGSADLAGSNLTIWDGCRGVEPDNASGNYIYYGVREFGMSAIANGISLHGGFIPYCGTFLIFMEYARNAVRLASLMGTRNIFVYTHDSIGLGEDGPTHQPVEQLANLRQTPNMICWRPCDAVETAAAWKCAIERAEGPSSLALSRQALDHQERSATQIADIARGGYILFEPPQPLVAVIIATGSEVGIAVRGARALLDNEFPVRVVSMPAPQRFDEQSREYCDRVLPPKLRARIAIEAAHEDYWYKYVGLDGVVIGLKTYGESAPAEQIFRERGFTVDNVVATVTSMVGTQRAT